MISATTRVCGLIGDPVEHSMSPVMHNAAFKDVGLDYIYLPFRVKKERLGQAISGMRALNIRGLNVTIPHKVDIIPLLDELEPLAKEIGAVNTIVNDDGTLKGDNTDATGFLKALQEKGIEPAAKKAVILGAGGASKAISFILARQGSSLVILNRPLEFDWAVQLAKRLKQSFQIGVTAQELNEANLREALSQADILVNATSVGMSPNRDETPVPQRLLNPRLVVFDIVYNPLKTRLLREAEGVGAQTIGGLEMLVWQGALAFEMWTGHKAPRALMKETAIKALGRDED